MAGSRTREAVKNRFAIDGAEYEATRFGHPRGRLLSECDARLFRRMLADVGGAVRVLEVGAGTGRFTTLALEHGLVVTATDVNATLLETLRENVSHLGAEDRCEIRVEDLFQLSFPDQQFDLVYSFHVIPRLLSLEDQRSGLIEIARTVKPGGRILFNYRNARSPYRFIYKGHTSAPEEIDRILGEAGLRVVDRRGKLLSSMLLFRRLPMLANHLVVELDVALSRFLTKHAWDVFIMAEKDQ